MTTDADNQRRIAQFTNYRPFPEGTGPRVKRGEVVRCKRTSGAISEGREYTALADSFMGVSFHEVLEYVMVANSEDTWGIYFIELFYEQPVKT